ncbi:hypothetical protein [Barrientosiimonas endolithica]|uniref:Uncharacterized protein n=1 Tax=Barrientosiimonas endolithica TaxID=1535208 RepID=A0ABN6YL25_9MICO|nr:hypothetical protein [Barrientosiimonas endolithica]BDZ58207.1 hypothetical protein GCM10025872_18640 [Barrientosiimonas endolithica]
MTAAARLVAAGVAALAGFGVTAVFAVLLAASVVAVGWGWWLTRRELASTPSSAPGLVAVLLRSNGTLAAFIALTNVDVLLARNFLTEHDSGGYALAATFARGMCWVTQFLALLVVPRMQRTDAARSLLVACGLVVALGMSVLALVSVSPRLWIEVAGGSSYVEFAPLVLWCVALGTAWSLAQVWLFAEMGGSSTAMGLLTWAVLAGECVAVAVWWHDSPEQILGVALVGALVIAATGLVRALLSHREVRLDERSVVAATDGPRT